MKPPFILITALIAISVFTPAVRAAVVGPYNPDADTLALFHFDEDAGVADPGTPFVNFGTLGASLDLTNTGGPDGRDNSGLGGYGAPSFTGFGNAFDVLAAGDGTRHATTSASGGGAATASTILQGSLHGSTGAFTYEAIIRLGALTDEQNIISHDGATVRGFLFRVINGTLALFNGTGSIAAPIPASGEHAFVPNDWFHVAITYNGDELTAGNTIFYWTALNSSAEVANQIGSPLTLTADLAASSSNIFGIGTTTRNPFRFEVSGFVDEVRLSSVARAPHEFLFVPEPATATFIAMGALAFAHRRRRA